MMTPVRPRERARTAAPPYDPNLPARARARHTRPGSPGWQSRDPSAIRHRGRTRNTPPPSRRPRANTRTSRPHQRQLPGRRISPSALARRRERAMTQPPRLPNSLQLHGRISPCGRISPDARENRRQRGSALNRRFSPSRQLNRRISLSRPTGGDSRLRRISRQNTPGQSFTGASTLGDPSGGREARSEASFRRPMGPRSGQ
jgi:hypothetical protein